MKSYEQFWAELAPAYPVSKGAMRLPIVAELQELAEIDMAKTLRDLAGLLQELLDGAGGATGAAARAVAAGEDVLMGCVSDTYTGIVRFDCVIDTAGAVHVLELNADYPDGFVLHDHTYSALAGAVTHLHREQLPRLFSGANAVHVAHPAEAGFLDGYHAERVALEAAGHTVSLGPVGERAAAAWQRRCVEVSKLTAAEIAAHAKSSAPVINSWSLRTLGYKQMLATVAHQLVPETLDLSDVNAVAQVAAEPQRWVIKPGQGCEGAGIYFGRDYAPAAWGERLAALPAGYVAQRYIDIAKRTVPVYDTGVCAERELYFDMCPHFVVVDGYVTAVGHVLMRFSESPIVNVSQGGAVGYHRLPAVGKFLI